MTADEETSTDVESGTGRTRSHQNFPVSPYTTYRIAVREFRILMGSHWGWGLVAFFAIFSVSVVSFGTSSVGPGSYSSVVISLVEFGVYIIPLVALTAGYDTIVGDYEGGTLNMLFALPVSRSQVLLGKYFGRLVVLLGSMVLGLAAGGVTAFWVVGIEGIALYSLFVLASLASGTVFLGLSVLLSTLTKKKIRALGYTQITWLWFVLLHDLVALGLIAEFKLSGGALEAMVLLNPTDLYRLSLLGLLEAPSGGFAALLTKTALTTPVIVFAVLLWILIPVGLADWFINQYQ